MSERPKPGGSMPLRTAVRFPLRLAIRMKTPEGELDAMTENISANGLLFASDQLPAVDSMIEFTMAMPREVMGSDSDVSIHCIGRVIRHQNFGGESMAAAVIDEYFLKA